MRRWTTDLRSTRSVLASAVLVMGSATGVGEALAQGVQQGTRPAANPSAARTLDREVKPARAAQEEPAEALDPKMEHLLKLWERQSRALKSLDVLIYRKDLDSREVLGGETHYQGTAKFESPNKAYIEFNLIKLDRNKKDVIDPKTKRRVTEPYERIKCTGNEVWQYKFDTKQIFVFPLNKEEQARALDEGPLPFLFNMKADEDRNRYHMTLLPEKEGSKVHLIKVRPRLAIDREDFGEALIELEKTYLLPTRIVLFSPDRVGTREYFLSHHTANPKTPIDPAYFKGIEYKDWKVVRNPKPEGEIQGRAAANPRATQTRKK